MAPIRWFILALQFTTILPAPMLKNVSESDLRRSVLFYPVIGLLLGFLLWVTNACVVQITSVPAAAVFSLAVYTVLTGALHIDGFMDTADALGSNRSRERALEIMRDSRIGAMGAVAGVLLLAGKGCAIAAIPIHEYWMFILIPGLSRLGMVWSMRMAPYARDLAGLGQIYAGKIPLWVEGSATVIVGVIFLAAFSFRGLYALVSAFLITWLFTMFMIKRFGGMTGDTYGALNELIEWLGWIFLPGLIQITF